MKIIVISQMFPCKRHPNSAVFFANLMKELALMLDDLIIITPRPYIPKILTKFKKNWSKWHLDPMISKENGMEIIRPYFLSLRSPANEGINGILMHYSLSGLVRKLVKERNIDLILGYNMIPDGIAAVRLANKLKLPSGFWAIGTDVNDLATFSKTNNYLTKQCIEDSNFVLTESKNLENIITNINRKSIIYTFYKGIDLSIFQSLPEKGTLYNKFGLDSHKKYLLFVGRLIYDKGIYELAAAFIHISKKYSDYELILVGEEIEKEKLMKCFYDKGLLNKVHFKGLVHHKEIANYMNLSDMLVFPTWAEGLPNVVMEAMAAGLPVISTNVGGIPEVLDNEITGLSVPAKDIEKLIESIFRMIEDVVLRDRCISNGKELIFNKFDVRKNAGSLYELLKNITTQQKYQRIVNEN